MKTVLLIAFLFSINAFGQIEKKVLFIGNSYTTWHNMSGIVSQMATLEGNTLIKEVYAPGGSSFQAHATNPTTLSKIASNNWDYVTLQEQSVRPAGTWASVNTYVFPHGKILVDSIRKANTCAIPIFYDTWGRRDGIEGSDSIDTFQKMNQRLYNSYTYMADKNSAKLGPVGIGFEHIYLDETAPIMHTELYSDDGSHPSIFGSYLAACIFYEIIFEASSEGTIFLPEGVSDIEADYIQSVANLVINSIDSVIVDYTNPEAEYTATFDGVTATYTNLSVHAFSYLWEFGDGETSTEEHPIHIYPDEADYEATLTAYYCGKESTTTDGTNYTDLDELNQSSFRIYPNPSSGVVTIDFEGDKADLEIYTIDGQLYSKTVIDNQITLSLPAGIYLVRVDNETRRLIIL
ncbi:MAG: PKD repeat protein [Crocinitomix sp.]|jgi:PKD repeat protein